MRSRYRIYEASRPHFFTCTIVRWIPIFARPDAAQIVLDSWQFLQRSRRMTIFGYVIMENHLHFIASSPDLAKEVGDFKSFTARRIIDELKNRGSRHALRTLKRFKARHKTDREYQLWQEGSKPKMIEGDEMMLSENRSRWSETGIHSLQPGEARVCRRSDALALLQVRGTMQAEMACCRS